MKNYKITLTENEVSKLSLFIVMFKEKLTIESESYKTLSEDISFSEEIRAKFESNSEWYKETFEIISKIESDLDKLPF